VHCWQKVREGRGQVALIAGDPGIGKSRLVYAMREIAALDTTLRWQGYCSPYYQNTAFHPVIDAFRRAAGFERTDTEAVCFEKLERIAAQYLPAADDAVPALASLLGLPIAGRYASPELSPQQRKQKTFEVLLAMLLAAAAREPMLLIVEDLQWVDPSTLELLTLLLDRIRDARVLCVLTFRREFVAPWTDRAHVKQITLRALHDEDVSRMLERLTGGKAVPAEVVDLVTSKADGVPLFVEEMLKMLLESDVIRDAGDRYELIGSAADADIPSSLQGLLAARLDRLAEAKSVAQLGAALGRMFTYDLIQAVSSDDEAQLLAALQRLVEADILFCRGELPNATYVFRHALIQDAAYQSLLKATRRAYHRRIADVLSGAYRRRRAGAGRAPLHGGRRRPASDSSLV
jgi:predicted ATPase